ncbi:MAG: hypothetical protein RSD51_03910 [Malacoplasma sp.]
MIAYSNVSKNPEILETIDSLLKDFNLKKDLASLWRNQDYMRYMVEFNIRGSDLNEELFSYQNKSNDEYYNTYKKNLNTQLHCFIIYASFKAINERPDLFKCQAKKGVIIPYSELKIIEL